MRITDKTVRLLKRLLSGETVNAGEFASDQQKELVGFLQQMRGITFKGIGRSRGSYYVSDKGLFQELCSQYDPVLKDLEAAARLAKGEVTSRAEKVTLFGDSKQDGADRTVRGFTILANRDVIVHYLGRKFPIGPLAGLHVVDWNKLVIPEGATVIIVENAECLYDLRWIPNVGLNADDGPFIILCRFPFCEEAKRWLEAITNRIRYFGDYDLAGIRIYETEFKRRLGNRISFIVPKDLERRIRKSGNSALYSKQTNAMSSTNSPSGELANLLTLLHNLQSCYEQEGYILPFIE